MIKDILPYFIHKSRPSAHPDEWGKRGIISVSLLVHRAFKSVVPNQLDVEGKKSEFLNVFAKIPDIRLISIETLFQVTLSMVCLIREERTFQVSEHT